MQSEEWARVRALLERVLDAPEDTRVALLRRECERDGLPYATLLELLQSETSESFLEPPAKVAFEALWRELE